jgi:isopenicillin N synthase-like dioxygenase
LCHNFKNKIFKVDKAFAESRKFFELPQDIKMKYRKTDAVENFHGYTPPEDERLNTQYSCYYIISKFLILFRVNKSEEFENSHKDHKEAWDFWGQEILKKEKYPNEVPELYAAINGYRLSLGKLSKKLLLCFGHYLKLEDPEFFLKRHTALDNLLDVRSHNDIRTNYYAAINPGEDIKEGSLRLGEHNDWGTITLLIQDTLGGLEAKQTDGKWIPVTPIKDSIILNAGLMLEMWSGGHFPATASLFKFNNIFFSPTRGLM